MKTNKQTIDSNAVSKVVNRKKWTGQSFSKMKIPANIVKKEYLYACVRHVTFFISAMCGWVWPSFEWVWPFLSGCGWVWPFLALMWVGVDECGLVGVGECTLYNCPYQMPNL